MVYLNDAGCQDERNSFFNGRAMLITMMLMATVSTLVGCGRGSGQATSPLPVAPAVFSYAMPVNSYGVSGNFQGSPGLLLYRANAGAPVTDIVTVDRTGAVDQLLFFRKDAAGVITPDSTRTLTSVDIPALTQPWSIDSADFDGNGTKDIVVQGNTGIAVILMRPDGSILTWRSVSTAPLVSPQFAATGDVNGDGYADIVSVENPNPGTVSVGVGFSIRILVSINDTMGGFLPIQQFSSSYSSNVPAFTNLQITGRPVLADLDNNGTLDLIVATFPIVATITPSGIPHTPGPVFIMDNGYDGVNALTRGTFPLKRVLVADGNLHPSGLVVGDVNNDTFIDIVVANYKGASVYVFPGNGVITGFSSFTRVATTSVVNNGITISDLNGDSRPEIIVANADQNQPSVEILYNDGSQFFATQSLPAGKRGVAIEPASFPVTLYNPGTYPIDVRSADMNGDGKRDIVTANYNVSNGSNIPPNVSISSFSVVLQQ